MLGEQRNVAGNRRMQDRFLELVDELSDAAQEDIVANLRRQFSTQLGQSLAVGWHRIEVPGATGYTDTDYAAKGRYAVDHLDQTDIVCVHVEATDEASHEGDVEAKIAALEAIDEKIVAPLHAALESLGSHRILITPDSSRHVRKNRAAASIPVAEIWVVADSNGPAFSRTNIWSASVSP